MHYYQFHIGDYASHTRHLSHLEDLAYRRLLDFYYLHENPIKTHEIARQIGMKDYEQDVLTVLNEFFMSTPDGFVNTRADKEIENFKAMSEGGKRGAAIRWSKGSHSHPIDPLIATNNHKPITKNQIQTPEGVDDLVWKDYVEFRKKRKAPITERVIEGLVKEAKIAKMSLNDVIKECVVRGWQSFKAEWVAGKQNPADRVHVTVPSTQERDPALVKLDQDRQLTKPPSLETLARMAALRRQA
jgi:uncharacterized protein YdaU (DUF1376 family)